MDQAEPPESIPPCGRLMQSSLPFLDPDVALSTAEMISVSVARLTQLPWAPFVNRRAAPPKGLLHSPRGSRQCDLCGRRFGASRPRGSGDGELCKGERGCPCFWGYQRRDLQWRDGYWVPQKFLLRWECEDRQAAEGMRLAGPPSPPDASAVLSHANVEASAAAAAAADDWPSALLPAAIGVRAWSPPGAVDFVIRCKAPPSAEQMARYQQRMTQGPGPPPAGRRGWGGDDAIRVGAGAAAALRPPAQPPPAVWLPTSTVETPAGPPPPIAGPAAPLAAAPSQSSPITEPYVGMQLEASASPNADEEEWSRRLDKRVEAVDRVKSSPLYRKALLADFDSVPAPRTPHPYDRTCVKRHWESQMGFWKAGLYQRSKGFAAADVDTADESGDETVVFAGQWSLSGAADDEEDRSNLGVDSCEDAVLEVLCEEAGQCQDDRQEEQKAGLLNPSLA